MKNQHINFKKRYAKLEKNKFTTVRWLDKFYKVGRVYDILYGGNYYLRNFLCQARCYKIELKKINQLNKDFCQKDADCGIDEFFRMMKMWYSKKPDWKDINSEVQVLYLEKINTNISNRK